MAPGSVGEYDSGFELFEEQILEDPPRSDPPLPELPLMSIAPIILSLLQHGSDVANFLEAMAGSTLHVASGFLRQPDLFARRLMLQGVTHREVLEKAVYNDNSELAKWAQEHLDVDAEPFLFGDDDELTALKVAFHLACKLGHNRAASGLLAAGAEASHGLWIACFKGHVDTVRLLLGHGADPNCGQGQLLESACTYGHTAVFEVLLEHGANGGAVDEGMHGLLQLACREGQAGMAQTLISKGADVNAEGGRAVYLASRVGHATCVEVLLRNGARVHSGALTAACRYYHVSVLRLLLQQGGEVPWEALQETARASRLIEVTPEHLEVMQLLQEFGPQE